MTLYKTFREWTMDMPWGKVAMVSWGNSANPPILMVHGYLDSCATFNLLVDRLPKTYYYISFDFPGHGKSDPFPLGTVISNIHFTEVIRAVVQYLNLVKFVYLGHSSGFLFGVYYNYIFPGKIIKMINIDPSPTLPWQHFTSHDPQSWARLFYKEYYHNYNRYNNNTPKLYTFDEAVSAVATTRNLTKEQAEVVLSRCLVPVDKDLYRLTWEPRMKKVASALNCNETLFTIITTNSPPMLNILASKRDVTYKPDSEEFGKNIVEQLRHSIPLYLEVTVAGGHDLHLTNPAALVSHIVDFLEGKLIMAKL